MTRLKNIVEDASDRLKKILNAKHELTDLEQLVSTFYELSPDQNQNLLDLLEQFENLFASFLDRFQMEPYNIELIVGDLTYHLKIPYTMPRAYMHTVKKRRNALLNLES